MASIDSVRIRPVQGYEGHYEVSETGDVYSVEREVPFIMHGRHHSRRCARRKLVPVRVYNRGRLTKVVVGLSINGKRHLKHIARLVARAFIGKCPPKYEVCHWDGNPLNNNVSNLRYDSHRNNVMDTIRHGNGNTQVLSEYDVAYIKFLLEHMRLKHREIGEMFGVRREVITKINTGQTWHHMAPLQPMA